MVLHSFWCILGCLSKVSKFLQPMWKCPRCKSIKTLLFGACWSLIPQEFLQQRGWRISWFWCILETYTSRITSTKRVKKSLILVHFGDLGFKKFLQPWWEVLHSGAFWRLRSQNFFQPWWASFWCILEAWVSKVSKEGRLGSQKSRKKKKL